MTSMGRGQYRSCEEGTGGGENWLASLNVRMHSDVFRMEIWGLISCSFQSFTVTVLNFACEFYPTLLNLKEQEAWQQRKTGLTTSDLFRDSLKCVKVSFPWWHWVFCLCVFLFRYENPLSPLGQHISSELGLTKRHFFEIPTPHCNLDLDEYEYDDDFEWFLFLFFILQCSCWAPSTLRNTSHAPGLVDKHHQTE